MRIDAPGGVRASSNMYAELERRVLGSSRVSGTRCATAAYTAPAPGTGPRRRGPAGQAAGASGRGGGTGLWSFVHVDDAAAATVAALAAEPGVYNVVDDNPEPVARWLPAFARWVGALSLPG